MTTFVEPVYLNERMMLNSAAYFFGGLPLGEQVTERASSGLSGGGTLETGANLDLGNVFLKELLGISGDIGGSTSLDGNLNRSQESSSVFLRQYTVGGLHMALLDALSGGKSLIELDGSDPDLSLIDGSSFVGIKAILRPVDYYTLLTTLKALSPLVRRLLQDDTVGPRLIRWLMNQHNVGDSDQSTIEPRDIQEQAGNYVEVLDDLVDQLEADYLSSKQLELIMISKATNEPLGVVELDLGNYDPVEMKAKLSGGEYYIVGKIVYQAEEGESLNLVEKTALSQALQIIYAALELDSQNQSALKAQNAFNQARTAVERYMLLRLDGPAIRLSAMSVWVKSKKCCKRRSSGELLVRS